ncbi:MAG: hypothetical protein KGJ13_11865 [Patescibacteria group bacterium]|nr:hypothetical protein [Patescibacteria group bacterium]
MTDDLAARDRWLRDLIREDKAVCPCCRGEDPVYVAGRQMDCPVCGPQNDPDDLFAHGRPIL